MKNTKKFAAFVASILAVACMAAPMATSFSADAAENTVTFTGEALGTHKYTAYQIFTGDAASNGMNPVSTNVELQNVNWAMDSDNAASFLTALKADARFDGAFNDCTTAAGVAAVLKGYTYNSKGAKDFADFVVEQVTKTEGAITLPTVESTGESNSLTISDDGYYVIAETELKPNEDGDGAMTAYLLGVYDASAGAEVKVKAAVPTFEKKIKDTNDSGTNDGSTNDTWQDSADHDINDNVDFQLTATLPADYATYKTYKMVFHDDLQADVFKLNTDSIKVYYQHDDGEITEIKEGFTVATESLGSDEVFKSTKTDKNVDFTLTFNDLKTVVSTLDADDKIIVEYNAKLTDSANIGSAGNWNSGYLSYSNNPNYKGEGADSPTSHTKEDLVVTFTYEVDVNKVDGKIEPLKGAGFTLYKWDTTAEGENKYVAVGNEIKAEDLTTFEFKGLDAGQYKLVESTVPNGYNQAADLEFVVSATHDEKADIPTLKTLTVASKEGTNLAATELSAGKFTVNKEDGKLATQIVNTSGSSLPSTGGIGTTIFYVAGGALVVGAGVLLVSKKRMSNK